MPERSPLWSVIEARDAGIARLHEIEKTQEAALALKEAQVQEKEAVIEELKASLREKESIQRLNVTLEEKEQIIAEQARALDAYRAAYAVTGWIMVPLNFVVLGVRSVIRRSTRSLTPRLGILNQHAPLEMRLPPHYSLPTALAATPKISIVTPSFRQAGFIERTLVSVLGQGYPNLEYFVQDGGSLDGTVEVIGRHASRLSGWDSRPDSGQAEAINRGFARTTGEIMAYLNSDDVLLPGALAYVADFFVRNPDVDVVYGHRILIDEEDRQIGRWMLPAHEDEVLSWADYVPQETLFWRRSIWEKAGGKMDETFRFALDWDLLIRFRNAGARFARLPRFLGGFRVHPRQKTSAGISEIGFKEMDRIRERVLGRVPSKIEVRRKVFPYLMRHVALDLRWRIQNKLGMNS